LKINPAAEILTSFARRVEREFIRRTISQPPDIWEANIIIANPVRRDIIWKKTN
jgi:hypothetical protein